MQIAKFIIEGKIKPKERPKFNFKTKTAFTPKSTSEQEHFIKNAFRLRCPDWKISNKPILMRLDVFFKMADSKSKKWKELNCNRYSDLNKDIDNIIKVVSDALNKVAYEDDKQVSVVFGLKKWGKDDLIKVELYELDPDDDVEIKVIRHEENTIKG